MSTTWERFVVELRSRVPGLPASVTAAFDVTRGGLLDHTQRTALRAAAAELAPAVAPGAIAYAATLGELHDLVDGVTERGSLVRGSHRTARVALRPLRPEDYGPIYDASLDPVHSYRWRFRGRTPSPETFRAALHDGVMVQFAVAEPETGSLIGLVSAYDEDRAAQHCQIAFQRIAPPEDHDLIATTLEGLALFIDYLFTTFPLRRVYAELPEYNLPLVASLLGNLCAVEGVRQGYYWHNGAWWDQHLLSVTRERWDDFATAWATEDTRLRRPIEAPARGVDPCVRQE